MNRKTITYTILFTMIALLSSGACHGQSIFGLNFIGEHRFNGGARHSGLGWSALALPDTNNALTMNPASLADLGSVTLSIYESMSMSRINTEDATADQNRFQLPTAILAVPVVDGLVLSVGYRTRFHGRGEFTYPRDTGWSPSPNELYKLNSSLYTAPLGLAWRPVDWLSVAGEVQLDRGSIKDEVFVYFNEPEYKSVSAMRTRGFSATSWGASFLAEIHPRFWIGGTFDDKVVYSVDEKLEYDETKHDSTSTWEFTLPSSWSLGAAVGLSERWWLSSSFWMRKAPVPDGYGQFDGALSDETLIAFGVERRASEEGGLFSRMPLRFGYYENRWHLEFPAGEQVVSRFFTFGSGFPMPGGPGGIDLTVEFGKTGSLADNLIDEKVLRFGISLSLSEEWKRRKVDKH